jgi:hypothetical protein
MTELQIYKFIHENELECRWQDFYENGKYVKKLNLWVPAYLLKDFCDLLGYSAFDDRVLCETTLCYDGSTFIENLDEVLECYDIDAENILKKCEN